MKDKKGQALVEFVIILPIFLFFLFAVIDVGKMIATKNSLENEMNILLEKYQNRETEEELKNLANKENKNATLEMKEDGDYNRISLKQEITIITPGLNLVFKNPYYVTVERWVKNES